eukprot:2015096-Amphidinium_carterae.1
MCDAPATELRSTTGASDDCVADSIANSEFEPDVELPMHAAQASLVEQPVTLASSEPVDPKRVPL